MIMVQLRCVKNALYIYEGVTITLQYFNYVFTDVYDELDCTDMKC